MSDVCVVVTICFRILLQLSHHIFKTKATVSGFFENAAFVFSHCFWNFLFLFHYTFLRRYQLKNFLMLPLVISFPISGKTEQMQKKYNVYGCCGNCRREFIIFTLYHLQLVKMKETTGLMLCQMNDLVCCGLWRSILVLIILNVSKK